MELNQDQLRFVIKQNHYLPGGTKKACLILRQFLVSDRRTMRIEEVNSLEVILAAAASREDEVPERWHCENDCHYTSDLKCAGEMGLMKGATRLCPFYSDDSDW